MTLETAAAHLEWPETPWRHRALTFQKACLWLAALLAVPGMVAWPLPGVNHWFPAWAVMSPSGALVSLVCAVSLALSLWPEVRNSHGLGNWVAAAAVALGVSAWIASGGFAALSRLFSLADYPALRPGEMTIQFAVAFLLLGLLLVVLNAERGIASHAADIILGILVADVMFLAARYIFQVTHLFGTSAVDPTPLATVVNLVLLTGAAALARARHGFYDVLLSAGIGGRIARPLTIIVVLLPFTREATRERLIRIHLVPEHGAAAFLAAGTAFASVILVMIVARYIRQMEGSIRHLSLRDELTGLYNLRGFKLLAEQALRMAQRSNLPFSLLFIDVDDLKQINDTMGHAVGSAMLAETAELLKVSVREADVVGRIGGDEFAIAGQFTEHAIVEAAERLEAQALMTRSALSHSLPISLSIGHVTARPGAHETLQQLLDAADAVMYNQKRRKKLQVC
jgi:diguanylate cyclase (GGDEF)-like protein